MIFLRAQSIRLEHYFSNNDKKNARSYSRDKWILTILFCLCCNIGHAVRCMIFLRAQSVWLEAHYFSNNDKNNARSYSRDKCILTILFCLYCNIGHAIRCVIFLPYVHNLFGLNIILAITIKIIPDVTVETKRFVRIHLGSQKKRKKIRKGGSFSLLLGRISFMTPIEVSRGS